MPSSLASHWPLDPSITFLNHGSFGACPRAVLARQTELRDQLESEPLRFMMRELDPLMVQAREAMATFVGADPDDIAFVPNATTGVNAVLRSLRLEPGEELLTTDHAYNACRNALDFVAERFGARVVVVTVPFPLDDAQEVVDAILGGTTEKTRLALLDHVTSPTGLVLPMAPIVAGLRDRGVQTLIDGAHVPGMLELDLKQLGATYYTGNCHKWMCAPKGAAFLYVQRDRQPDIHPVTISHGANANDPSRSRFRHEFDWTGTGDPTPALCVPTAIDVVGGMVEGGWAGVREHNRRLALQARDLLGSTLRVDRFPAPPDMIGSLVALPVPGGLGESPKNFRHIDPIQECLFAEHHIEVPIYPWPPLRQRFLRVSAHLHNDLADYRALAEAWPHASQR